MELVPIRCRSCGATIPTENISMKLAIARCGHCDAVFAITGHDKPSSQAPQSLPRPKVPMPKGIAVQNYGSRLEITRRWFGPSAFGLLFFCIIWNGFMIFWHGMALSSGAWFMSLFGLLHTAVGVGLLYATIATFVNITTIVVDRGVIDVKHGPLPWAGAKTTPTHGIKQLYCRENVKRTKNGVKYSYNVEAIAPTGTRIEVVKGLTDCDQAIFLEQTIEEFLQIDDVAVDGEVGR